MKSNAASNFAAAICGVISASCHGRGRVPLPNMSAPPELNECQ